MGNKTSGIKNNTKTTTVKMVTSTNEDIPPPVPLDDGLQKPTKTSKAASKIQAAWKGHKTRSFQEDAVQWKLFNDLENHEEADILALSEFLEALNRYMPRRSSEESPEGDESKIFDKEERSLQAQLSIQSIGGIDISEMYEGIRLNEEIVLDDAIALIDSYKHGLKLHTRFVVQIVQQVIETLTIFPNIKHVNNISEDSYITVVGDLHGQLDDLLLIFRENGLPSETNSYVFNGDFVDRGHNSIEIALILYIFQILYPSNVHINRGNHEDNAITTVFGFMKECQDKYDLQVYELFLESFRWLPVATVINKRVLVLHGGLSRFDFDLESIDLYPRWEYQLARTYKKPTTSLEKLHEDQMEILRDIYWSDPRKKKGIHPNSRGAGILFGPDIVEKFLAKNNLKLIIRSHECVPQGYDWVYGKKGMLLTLFSASNYCNKANNYGAFCRVYKDTQKMPVIFQYMAQVSERDLISTNLDGLFSIICKHSTELSNAFEQIDIEKKGSTSLNQWIQVMEKVLQLNLQWRRVQPLLTTMNDDGKIDYNQFLNRYHVIRSSCNNMSNCCNDENDHPFQVYEMEWKEKRDLFNALYKHRSRLEALFRTFDLDKNGIISEEEFYQGIELLNQHLPENHKKFTDRQKLMKLLERNSVSSSHEININEFMESFRINAQLTLNAKWQRARKKIRVLTAFNSLVPSSSTPSTT